MDSFESKTGVVLVYEYCEGGNAKNFLDMYGPLPEKTALKWIGQIVEGLKVLGSYNVIHRDIKLENILIANSSNSNAEFILKIADFGLCSLNPNIRETASIGSPAFIAPECLINGLYTTSSDIYALGVIAHELFTGTLPFHGLNPHNLLE